MKKIVFVMTVMLMVLPGFMEMSAQTIKTVADKKEKKEETKEKVVEKVVEKSGSSLEYELKRVFGMKSETSLDGSRIENLGKYFLDKYTGQVTLVTYQRSEPIRYMIQREETPEDYIYEEDVVNYQLIRYGEGSDRILLININSGAMWAIDTKGFTYKNTRLKYIPAVDAKF